MDLLDTINIASSGLTAQRVRVQTIASNLANARTTRTPDGGPYKRRAPVFVAEPVQSFDSALASELSDVRVERIVEIDAQRMVFDPKHPDADAEGFVAMPDIDVVAEMVDLMTASRSYEASVNAVNTTRDMALRALDIGR